MTISPFFVGTVYDPVGECLRFALDGIVAGRRDVALSMKLTDRVQNALSQGSDFEIEMFDEF